MIKARNRLPDQQVVLTGARKKLHKIWDYRELYVFLFLGLVTTFIFSYIPIYGILMAFQDARIGTIIGQAEWVGLYHFEKYFNGLWFETTLGNTVKFAVAGNLMYYPAAVLLALFLHNSTNSFIKKAAQNLTYIPHMLSTVVVFAIVNLFINQYNGLISVLLERITGQGLQENLYTVPGAIMPIYLITGIWQNTGYSAIIYIGALSNVDAEIEEAARIDGASKWRLIWNIQIPTILPTLVTVLIMNMASVLGVGTEKMFMIQNDLNLRETEIIGTYVYKQTLTNARYGFSTAITLFQNVVELILMLIFNKIGDKLAGISVI